MIIVRISRLFSHLWSSSVYLYFPTFYMRESLTRMISRGDNTWYKNYACSYLPVPALAASTYYMFCGISREINILWAFLCWKQLMNNWLAILLSRSKSDRGTRRPVRATRSHVSLINGEIIYSHLQYRGVTPSWRLIGNFGVLFVGFHIKLLIMTW